MKTNVEAKKRGVARKRAAIRWGMLAAILLAAFASGASFLRNESGARVQTVDISALEAPATSTETGEIREIVKNDKVVAPVAAKPLKKNEKAEIGRAHV